jgi:hypothetical protein
MIICPRLRLEPQTSYGQWKAADGRSRRVLMIGGGVDGLATERRLVSGGQCIGAETTLRKSK